MTISILMPVLDKLLRRSELTTEECSAVLALPVRQVDLKRTDFLVHEGDPTAFCCALLTGFVARQKNRANGALQIIAVQFAGDVVDLANSFLRVADHSVQALGDASVGYIPRAALAAVATAFPAVGQALWVDTLVDASISREWLLNLGQRDARERLCHLFCEMAARQHEDGTPGTIHMPLSQEQLGSAMGITPVHVNRVLKGMRADKLITLVAGTLTIPNWANLKAAGDFDSTYLHFRDSAAMDRRMAS